MNSEMTLERLASPMAVSMAVGARPSKRWLRPNPLLRRADNVSIYEWFVHHEPEERMRLLREAILEEKPWSSLFRLQIPKRPGSTEMRTIDMPTVLDAARLYLIHDWLQHHAETILTRVAVAFRPDRSFSDTILGVHQRMASLPFASVVDIKAFYDSIDWDRADAVIDALPADKRLQDLLGDLVRVDVVERNSGRPVSRTKGIPQGLSVSPVLANLFLAEFDRTVAQALGRVGARVWRYCDDILVLAPSLSALEHSSEVLRDRLSHLGLQVKSGTGLLRDTREVPVRWLGLSMSPTTIDVPAEVIERKTHDLQSRYDLGLLSLQGLEDSLLGKEKHYSRILGPERAREVIQATRAGLRCGSPGPKKEGIELLKELVSVR